MAAVFRLYFYGFYVIFELLCTFWSVGVKRAAPAPAPRYRRSDFSPARPQKNKKNFCFAANSPASMFARRRRRDANYNDGVILFHISIVQPREFYLANGDSCVENPANGNRLSVIRAGTCCTGGPGEFIRRLATTSHGEA